MNLAEAIDLLTEYADALDVTERPSEDEPDITAAIREVCSAALIRLAKYSASAPVVADHTATGCAIPSAGGAEEPATPSRFQRLVEFLQKWRDEDHEDFTPLGRGDIIELLEGIYALRGPPPGRHAQQPLTDRRDEVLTLLEKIVDLDTTIEDGGKVHMHGGCASVAITAIGIIVGAQPPRRREDQFDFDVFERATDIMARRLALFRTDNPDAEPTENERLTAGHLAGGLAANSLLVTTTPSQEANERK